MNLCCHPRKDLPNHGASKTYNVSDFQVISVTYTTGRCMAILRNLTPNTEYKVEVCAVNDKGEGKPAHATVITKHEPGMFKDTGGIWLHKLEGQHTNQVIRRMILKSCFHIIAFTLLALYLCLIFQMAVNIEKEKQDWCNNINPNPEETRSCL